MTDKRLIPEFIFESSWEVCNKMGGIYTVLSTHAKSLHEMMSDHLMFIGPDVWAGKSNPLFTEDTTLLSAWRSAAEAEGLRLRLGRWNVPGQPMVALVDFTPFYAQKNEIYTAAWNDFGVDSLHAYGDYDEASMFSYAAARVAESFYRHVLEGHCSRVVYHAHEWMTALGALYIKKHVPAMATVFTTHATTVGRSIAGNGKPLYEYLWAYDGMQMSRELNVESKHSVERQAAHHVDCFSTVSDVTARECRELLDRPCDAVLMNGFEDDFVPRGAAFTARRRAARKRIFRVANALTGCTFSDDTFVVTTSGRYEYKNKGIDVFLEALYRYSRRDPQRPTLALIEVPAWVFAPRLDLQQRLSVEQTYTDALQTPVLSHWLHNEQDDQVCRFLREHDIWNRPEDRLKVIFVPCYLDGHDGIFDLPYYDLLIGDDMAVYPSYYEPWGYTPLEAVAFHVPCVTTSLSGFGMWANKVKGEQSALADGVAVIPRDDYNFDAVADGVADAMQEYAACDARTVKLIRQRAAQLAAKARWDRFIQYYFDAYDLALRRAAQRVAAHSPVQ